MRLFAQADGVGALGAWSVSLASSCEVNEFGYASAKVGGTQESVCTYPDGHREAFVIGTSWAIWHAWRGSGGWRSLRRRAGSTFAKGVGAAGIPSGGRPVIGAYGTDNLPWCDGRGPPGRAGSIVNCQTAARLLAATWCAGSDRCRSTAQTMSDRCLSGLEYIDVVIVAYSYAQHNAVWRLVVESEIHVLPKFVMASRFGASKIRIDMVSVMTPASRIGLPSNHSSVMRSSACPNRPHNRDATVHGSCVDTVG